MKDVGKKQQSKDRQKEKRNDAQNKGLLSGYCFAYVESKQIGNKSKNVCLASLSRLESLA